jgi:hypothetical protein
LQVLQDFAFTAAAAVAHRAGANTFTIHLPSVEIEQFSRKEHGSLANGTACLPDVRRAEKAAEDLLCLVACVTQQVSCKQH